jgi:CDP-paratose 2-epimerase
MTTVNHGLKRVVVTGSCGFIGTCLCRRLIEDGVEVLGIDNMSRRGTELNARELESPLFTLHRTDLSRTDDVLALFATFKDVGAVFHLAGQVAVTTSYRDRRADFNGNALSGFNVLEAVKRYLPDAWCLYSSTNKVYGYISAERSVGLDFPLWPYTPYGVSKAVSELYFTEYGRPEIGLSTCSLRQSCIYGHHQFGIEDQGWLAWFAVANLLGLPITMYGDGKQVRDVLYIDDLVDLYLECAARRIDGVFPVGGGEDRAIALETGLSMIEDACGQAFVSVSHGDTRPGDQPYFVADMSWLDSTVLGWRPKTEVKDGIARMVAWLSANEDQVRTLFAG